MNVNYHYPQYRSFSDFNCFHLAASINNTYSAKNLKPSKKASNLSRNSSDSDVFHVKQASNDQSLPRINTPVVLNSTEMLGNDTREMISKSSIASPEPQTLTIDSDSNEPTMPYGFGRQLQVIPPSLNDLNLPPNPFNILATMAVVNHVEDGYVDNHRPQLPEPLEPSPISTPPMNISSIDGWETPHTTKDDNIFYSDDELRRTYFLPSTPTPPLPSRKLKRKLGLGMFFPKREGVLQHVCEACGQLLPELKNIPCSSTTN